MRTQDDKRDEDEDEDEDTAANGSAGGALYAVLTRQRGLGQLDREVMRMQNWGGKKLGARQARAKAGFVSHLVIGLVLKSSRAFVSPSPLLDNGQLHVVAVTRASLSIVTGTAVDSLCGGLGEAVVADSSLSINEPERVWVVRKSTPVTTTSQASLD